MAERLINLLYQPGFDERITSFQTGRTSMSVQIAENELVSFSSQDDEPWHAKLHTKKDGQEVETTFRNLVLLYQVANEKDPKNTLTYILKGKIMAELNNMKLNLDKQYKDIEILEERIEFFHGDPHFNPGHP